MLLLTDQDIEALVDMNDIIEAIENAFIELSDGTAICPKRSYIETEKYNGTIFIMPSYLSKMDAMATKIVTNYPDNLSNHNLPTLTASVILNNPRNGKMISLMEGTFLTALRTGAVSGVATRYLARKNSRIIGVIGTGAQAKTQLWAMREVLEEIEEIRAFDINPGRAKVFAEEMSQRFELNTCSVATSRQAVENSDIIITATTSVSPVFNGKWLKAGTHVNSVGWMGPNARELDDETVIRSRIVTDTREGILSESGDVLIPLRRGIITEDDIKAELSEIVTGKEAGRTEENEITLLKTVGLAIEDAATAKIIYQRAIDRGVGTEIDF